MFKENIYISRRKILSNQINEGMILLPGNMPVPMNYPSNTLRFRQDSNFLYYCGLDYPNLTIVIDSTNGETTLFGDDLEVDDIVWEGERVTVKKMAESAGIDHVEKNSPLRRNVTIQEVGDTASFLASDGASGITGQVLYVDSGFNIIGMPAID